MSSSAASLPLSNRNVVIVLTSHDRKGSTGQPTGAYLSEVSHPYAVLAEAGARITFASVKGGRVPLDGVDRADPINAAFLDDADRMERLHASKRAGDIDPKGVDAVFFAGGHGTMWDFPDDPGVAKLAAAVYERGGVVGAVCHGPAALVNARLSSGTYLVDGKDVAAFTDDEERAVGLGEVVPFFLASKLKERGAKHHAAANWQAKVVVSERLVTGQNPASAQGVAEAMVKVIQAL